MLGSIRTPTIIRWAETRFHHTLVVEINHRVLLLLWGLLLWLELASLLLRGLVSIGLAIRAELVGT